MEHLSENGPVDSLPEIVQPENDPRANGEAEEIRKEITEPFENNITEAQEQLAAASDILSEVEEMIDDLEGDHEDLKKRVHDAFGPLEEGQFAIDKMEGYAGRAFDSITIEDKLTKWAACHDRFPELAKMVERKQGQVTSMKSRLEKMKGLEAEVERLRSQVDALGPLS